MTTVPNVADGQLISTAWGNTVATVTNTELVRRDGSMMTGALILPGPPAGPSQATTKSYVDGAIASAANDKVNKAGDTMTGILSLDGADGAGANAAMRRQWILDRCGERLALTGGTMSGALNMGAKAITNLADPSSAQGAATVKWCNDNFAPKTALADALARIADLESQLAALRGGG